MSEPGSEPLGETVSSQHLGVRVWTVHGTSLQELMDRVAVVLGEHLEQDDELHISYNAMESGYAERQVPRVFGAPKLEREVFFEYSALIVLRARARAVEQSWSEDRDQSGY